MEKVNTTKLLGIYVHFIGPTTTLYLEFYNILLTADIEMVDTDSILNQIKPITIKNWHLYGIASYLDVQY